MLAQVAELLGIEEQALVDAFHAATRDEYGMEMRREGIDVPNHRSGYMEWYPTWRMLLVCGPERSGVWDRLQYAEPKT